VTTQKPGAEASAEASSTASSGGISKKGLSAGSVGLIGAIVIGISCIAPAYTLTAALGPTVSEVGVQVPAIIIVGFIPMLLVAFGYRELNRAMPDSGTSFTWATRAFGPWIGWMAGWGLIAATILVLSNLAGIAVDFFYLMLSQIFSNPSIADLTLNPIINVVTCLAFMAGATIISYRDMQTTQKLQYVLVGFQLFVLLLFGVAAIVHMSSGSAFDLTPVSWEWFNPFEVASFGAFAAGLSLSIFIFWGWDVTLTMSEEPVRLGHVHRFRGRWHGGVRPRQRRDPGQRVLRAGGAHPRAVRRARVDRRALVLGRVSAVDLRLARPHAARHGPLRRTARALRPGEPAVLHARFRHHRFGRRGVGLLRRHALHQ
jgi:hypothetical protein